MEQQTETVTTRSRANRKAGQPTTSNSSATEKEASYFDDIISSSVPPTCKNCLIKLTKIVRVLCPWGNFCVPCFSKFPSFPPSFYLVGKLSSALLEPKWTAVEEMLLANAVQKWGYGNWEQIHKELTEKLGDHLGGKLKEKTPQEIEQHYEKLLNYVQKPQQPDSKGKLFGSTEQPEEDRSSCPKMKNELKMLKEEMGKCQIKSDNDFKMFSYCSKRGDFEIEYDNDLELIVSEMEILESDPPEVAEMKEKALMIFSQRLAKRNTIKDFVIGRRLLDLNELNRKERRRTKEEREIAAMLIPFARFTTAAEHEDLIAGVAKEKLLRQQITTYIEEKRKGYRSLNEYQENSLSRKKKLDLRRKMRSKPNTPKMPSLSQQEYELCNQLQISQASYVMMRETIRSETSRRGKVAVEHFYSIFRLKPAIVSQVVAFVSQLHPNR